MEQVLITSDGSLLEDIDLSPATVIEDVIQNIATILATIKGTIPYMRGFGRNRETEGRPMPVVKNMIVCSVFEYSTAKWKCNNNQRAAFQYRSEIVG